MDVFISWSGNKSKKIAQILSDWLPAVIQAVKPYFTPDDLSKGTKWNTEIAKELEACRIGLICLTPDNFNAPWVLFEAGALSKNLDKSRVCPILFEIEPTNVTGPLVQFQFTQFNKDDFRRLVGTINSELAESKIADNTLNTVFDMWWPSLEERVKAESAKLTKTADKSVKRSDRELLEELLSLVRTSAEETKHPPIHPGAISDLMGNYMELVYKVAKLENGAHLVSSLQSMYDPLEYIVRVGARSSNDIAVLEEARHILRSMERPRKALVRRSVKTVRPLAASSEDTEDSSPPSGSS